MLKVHFGDRKTIPNEIGGNYLRYRVRIILLNEMTYPWKDLHLKLALHLTNGHRSVKTVNASKKKHLRTTL